jgi:phage virion morphogenesis protein
MTNITIEVHDQAVRAALDALGKRLANMRPVLKDIGEGIVQRSKARFSAEAGPDGQGWKPKKKADGRKTLSGPSGDLRRQIVSSASATGVTVTATAPYAAIHQFGGTINRKAGQTTVSHRTNAKGELLRSAIMNGKGLIFAKGSHKRKVTRTFDVAAHTITMPARPFLPVRSDGTLYAAEQAEILTALNDWLAGRAGA